MGHITWNLRTGPCTLAILMSLYRLAGVVEHVLLTYHMVEVYTSIPAVLP